METKMAKMPLHHHYLPLMAYVLYYFRQSHTPPEFPELQQQIDQLWHQGEKQLCANGVEQTILSQLQLPVAAWVDEMILTSEWPVRQQWQNHTLQRRLFQTTNAGQLFYDNLFQLKDDEDEIRQVYALCLNLGFSGAYFHPDDTHKRQQAQLKAGIDISDETLTSTQYLFPAAYQTLQSSPSQNFRWQQVKSCLAFLLPPAAVIGVWFFYQHSLNQQLLNYFSQAISG